MFESFGFETLTPRQAAVVAGLLLGLLYGVFAQRTRFCFRRAMAGPVEERNEALGVWLTAFAFAMIGTQIVMQAGLIDLSAHRFLAAQMPLVGTAFGGIVFGAGMVLTRGCPSRLTVLMASGNLRALMVLVVFAITAHAAMKGVLAPLRIALTAPTVEMGLFTALSGWPGGAWLWTILLAGAALFIGVRSQARRAHLAMAAALGLLVAAGWAATGYVLQDEFDPIAIESLSFTLPWAESLFWAIASSSIPAGFGTGLVGGALTGALLAALASREFQWQSFSSPGQTGRYMAGAVMMGLGGVLAGGCTVGAGLSGTATLSVVALIALVSFAFGAKAMIAILRVTPSAAEYGGPAATRG
jgi:uncharacterized membrane protein YedE/YeeE